MSKHRRTKSNGNYGTIPLDLLMSESVGPNETQTIIQNIQQNSHTSQQIVETLDDNSSNGIYNSLFRFGKGQTKQHGELDLSIISETSSQHSMNVDHTPKPNHRRTTSQMQLPVLSHIEHNKIFEQLIHDEMSKNACKRHLLWTIDMHQY